MTATVLSGVKIYMEIYLPRLFELMTQPDPIKILEWYVSPGDIVQPGANMLKVRAPGRTIIIPTPPEMVTDHRIVSRTQQQELHLGDFVMKLEPVVLSI